MKYLIFSILILSFTACSKHATTPKPVLIDTGGVQPVPVYRYIGTLHAQGYHDAGGIYPFNLDTNITDTVFITILKQDSLQVQEHLFEVGYTAVMDSIYFAYNSSPATIKLRSDSTYVYIFRHFVDSAGINGSQQTFTRYRYLSNGPNGLIVNTFSGTKR